MYIIIGCCTKQSDDFDCVKTDMPHGRDHKTIRVTGLLSLVIRIKRTTIVIHCNVM